jgi:hypothetical protein
MERSGRDVTPGRSSGTHGSIVAPPWGADDALRHLTPSTHGR